MATEDVLIHTDDDGTEHWERRVAPDSAAAMVNVYDSFGTLYLDPADGSGDLGHRHGWLEIDRDPSTMLDQGVVVVEMPAIAALPEGATVEGRYLEFGAYSEGYDASQTPYLVIDRWESGGPPTNTTYQRAALDDAPETRIIADLDWAALPLFEVIPERRPVRAEAVALIETGSAWRWRATFQPTDISGGSSGGMGDETLVFGRIATTFAPTDVFDSLGAWEPANPRYVIAYTLPGTVPPAPTPAQPEIQPTYHLARQTLAATRQPQIIVGLRAR